MKIESLDHVALWVAGRDELADFLTQHTGMHVIDRTDAFTIVGADARRGKLTLFAVDGPTREPGPLARIVLRVGDLAAARARIPEDVEITETEPGLLGFRGPQNLDLGLVESDGVDYDLHHVVLRASDVERTYEQLADLGFRAEDGHLHAGDAWIELEQTSETFDGDSLLNHFGLRVESASDHIDEAKQRGLDIADVVDAANTLAVFVWGPERIKLEYVEHKASFSLV